MANTIRTSALVTSLALLCGTSLFAWNDSPQPRLSHASAFAAGQISAMAAQRSVSLSLPAESNRTPSSEFNLVYHVLGLGNGFPNFNVPSPPPNPTLAVGGSEVIQAAGGFYSDFDKSTGAIIPLNGQDSTLGNTIWHELLPGTSCANSNIDNGELLIKFDRAASRWIVTQNNFLSYAVCIAVSQTATFSDNLWYAYQFPVFQAGFPDYTKWGVWSTGAASDGYYQTWNNFGPGGNGYQGPVICGYHRAKLLVGDSSAEQICFQLTVNESSLLPADVDSPVGPPATEDEFFIGSVDAVDNSHLSLYSMHINDWATGNATMTGLNNSQLIAVAPYMGACNGQFGGNCVPQPGGSDLASLGDRLMYRFAYWNDQPSPTVTAAPPIPPPLQHWLVNFSVESSTGQIGVRWFEFIASHRTIPVTSLSVFQQGTFAGSPADTNYRWMGSIARDNVQNFLLGYSILSSSMFPSIALAGRKYGDPQGTLSGEQFALTGGGAQDSSPWGQYSTMEIDPSDNCTFFYTTEYYMMTAVSDWSTDISSWKFPNCH